MPCLHCDLSEILEQTKPPDIELVDLIEQAYLEGQIDAQKADLACCCLCLETANRYCINVQ